MRIVLVLLGVGLLLAGCGSGPPPERGLATAPPASACSPSVRINGYSDELNKTDFQGSYVGNLSGLAALPDGNVVALSDRSVLFTLAGPTHRPIASVPLVDENEHPLDSEAVTRDTDGTLLITSEVEPSIRRYTSAGQLLGRLPVPDALRVAPAGRASSNLTFEGLALQPDGRTLVASMEAALRGDQGNLVRFQTWTLGGTGFVPAAQYGYRVDQGLGVSELAAEGDGRLLVLERGYLPGVGNTVRLYLADPAGASDVSAVTDLTSAAPVHLIGKTLLADLVRCPSLGAINREHQANPLLDNIEGMTVTGRGQDGALHVLLVSDDNHSAKQTTRLYSLTVVPGK